MGSIVILLYIFVSKKKFHCDNQPKFSTSDRINDHKFSDDFIIQKLY